MINSGIKLKIDNIVKIMFMLIGIVCASSIVVIVIFIVINGVKPFIHDYGAGKVPFLSFITGLSWSNNAYGVLGMAINTIYLTAISALVALPLSVLTALFIVRIAPRRIAGVFQMVIELLASIPSIVFGLFGMGVINPMVKNIAKSFGVQTAGGISVLSTIIVLIIMMMPTITMLSITSMKAVKQNQIHASLALGATSAQTNFKIVIGGAKSGIFAALILGIGRALGEATAVSMVCGNAPSGPNFNIFDTTRTLTSTMMLGLHEASGQSYDIRFSVGIVLIVIILVTNIVLNRVKQRLERV